MAKVLISFIGTGPLVNKGTLGRRSLPVNIAGLLIIWVKRIWVNTHLWQLLFMKHRI